MCSAVGKRRQLPPLQRAAEWHLAVSGPREAGKMARDAEVVLAVEPLNRFETDLINKSEQCIRLVDEIGSPAVKMHLDTFHMNIDEHSIFRAIRFAGARLPMFTPAKMIVELQAGTLTAWQQRALGLRNIGYAGAVVIESFTP